MTKNRLEAFSDGVIAIILTIMVLELKAPTGAELNALLPLWPTFLCYLLSYVYIGIYWNNHHHLLQATHRVNGLVLMANMHLLFWLSLVPFVTSWMGANNFAPTPTAIYGVNLFMAAVSYKLLQQTIIRENGIDSILAKAIGPDWKGNASIAIYILAITLAYANQALAGVLYAVVAIIWLVPDQRIERVLVKLDEKG